MLGNQLSQMQEIVHCRQVSERRSEVANPASPVYEQGDPKISAEFTFQL